MSRGASAVSDMIGLARNCVVLQPPPLPTAHKIKLNSAIYNVKSFGDPAGHLLIHCVICLIAGPTI